MYRLNLEKKNWKIAAVFLENDEYAVRIFLEEYFFKKNIFYNINSSFYLLLHESMVYPFPGIFPHFHQKNLKIHMKSLTELFERLFVTRDFI